MFRNYHLKSQLLHSYRLDFRDYVARQPELKYLEGKIFFAPPDAILARRVIGLGLIVVDVGSGFDASFFPHNLILSALVTSGAGLSEPGSGLPVDIVPESAPERDSGTPPG